MTITRKTVATKLAAYLGHELALGDLVEWAEEALQEGTFEARDIKLIAAVVGRIGVADVRGFGLAWEDCEQLLKQLGYSARVDISAAQSR
jgi:hypothetical protein